MSTQILQVVVLLAAIIAWSEWRMHRGRARAIRAAEATYDRTFDLAESAPRLDEYFELLCGVLPPAALRASPVTEAVIAPDGPAAQARAAVAFAATRFGLVLPPFDVAFTPHLAPGRDGELCWDEPWEIVLSGDQAVIRSLEGRAPNWQVRLREGLQHDPERLVVVAAHEVAHVALLSRDIRLSPASENELLTDAAVVLAGFGALMEGGAFSVRHYPRSGRALRWSINHAGYLHRSAIRHLSARRAALSSPDAAQATAG